MSDPVNRSEIHDLIEETAGRIFREQCTKEFVDEVEAGASWRPLWNVLEESGLTLAGIAENLGGGGADALATMLVLRQAGNHAAPIPLAETYLAARLLAAEKIAAPSGPMAVAIASESDTPLFSESDGASTVVNGEVHNVPWGGSVDHVVVLGRDSEGLRIAIVPSSKITVTPGTDLAGNARDGLRFDNIQVDAAATVSAPSAASDSIQLGALCCAVLMAGALERILALTVEHAGVREQFGRPIGSFQAIRQQIAVLAGHVAAASKAAESAVYAMGTEREAVAIAAAKIRCGEAAGIVSETAHQVHGAIGVSHEHALHQYTRRVWTWRDDCGNERAWSERLGREVATAGAEGLWKFIVGE